MDRIQIEIMNDFMKKGFVAKDIARELIKRGFLTPRGKKPNAPYVYTQISIAKRKGIIAETTTTPTEPRGQEQSMQTRERQDELPPVASVPIEDLQSLPMPITRCLRPQSIRASGIDWVSRVSRFDAAIRHVKEVLALDIQDESRVFLLAELVLTGPDQG